MRSLIKHAQTWLAAGERLVLATVTHVDGSSPQPAGAKMVISASGRACGSVSGGCVEAAVIEEASTVFETGTPTVLRFTGNADEISDVKLSCGGTVNIFLAPLDAAYLEAQAKCYSANHPCAIAVCLDEGDDFGSRMLFSNGDVAFSSFRTPVASALENALAKLISAHSGYLSVDRIDGRLFFIEVVCPPPVLIIIGAVQISLHLAALGRELGFKIIVIDPRPAFADAGRFPNTDEIIQAWPDEALKDLQLDDNAYVAILTHDPKFDEPSLKALLMPGHDIMPPNLGYIGAIGSRATHKQRFERMEKIGVTREMLKLVYAPTGLDLGASNPAEIALSIMAEIIAVKNNRSGGMLYSGSGRISAQ